MKRQITFILLIALTIAIPWNAWGQEKVTLTTIDFSTWENQTICPDKDHLQQEINGVTFLTGTSNNAAKSFNVTDGVLTFCDNNISSNKYYFGFPLINVNGKIYLTIHNASGKSFQVKYVWKGGENVFNNNIGSSTTTTKAQPSTVNIDASHSSGYIYIGRSSSSEEFKTITKIIVETDAPSCTSITPTLSYTKTTWEVGETATAALTDNPSSGTVTYSSSAPAVATVDENTGTVTAMSAGRAKITATIEAAGGYCSGSASVDFIVVNEIVAATGVGLDKTILTLTEGEEETLVATVAPTTATNQNVTWTSLNEDIVTVDNDGKVTAIAVGTTTITVTTEDGNHTATCDVTVTSSPCAVTKETFATTIGGCTATKTNGTDSKGKETGVLVEDSDYKFANNDFYLQLQAPAGKYFTSIEVNLKQADDKSFAYSFSDDVNNFTYSAQAASNSAADYTLTPETGSKPTYFRMGRRIGSVGESASVYLYKICVELADLPTYAVNFGVKSEQETMGSVTAKNGAESITSGNELASGTTITFTAKPNSGYLWTGWYSNAECTVPIEGAENPYTATITNATNVYAQFTPAYTVTYAAGEATSGTAPTDDKKYASGTTVTVLGNTNGLAVDGKAFVRWTDGTTTYLPDETFTITANTTLTAVFETVSFVVTYNAETYGGDGATNSTETYTGTPLTLPTPTYNTEGLDFLGWYKADENKVGDAGDAYSPVADITLYAHFKATVTYKDGATILGNEEVKNLGKAVNYETYQTKALAAFVGWYAEEGCTNLVDLATTKITRHTALYGKWTPVYAKSVDIENYVFDYEADAGAGAAKAEANLDGAKALLDAANVAYTNINSIDNGNSHNGIYNGLKFKSGAGNISFRVEANKLVILKTGFIGATSTVSLNGDVITTLTSADENVEKRKQYYYYVNEETLFTINFGSESKTCVFKALVVTDPYEVTFDVKSNASGASENNPTAKFYGEAITLPVPTYNIDFKGWYNAQNGGNKIGDAGDSYIPEGNITLYAQYEASTLVVAEHNNETISADASYNNVTVQPNGKLNVNAALTVSGDLVLQAKENARPQIEIEGANNIIVNGSMSYEWTVTAGQDYPVSMPCNVDIAEVKYWTGSDWDANFNMMIAEYDGEHRATEGEANAENPTNWKHTDGSIFAANKGYIIRVTGKTGSVKLLFPLNNLLNTNIVTVTNSVAVQENAIDPENAKVKDFDAGWNFVGNPFLAAAKASGLAGYITHNNGASYTLTENNVVPFTGMFVQVDNGTALTFTNSAADPIRAENQANTKVTVKIALDEADYLGLRIADTYTTAYELTHDLLKMFGSAQTMSIYTLEGNTRLAYNAMPNDAANAIPVGFSATAGEHTIALMNNPALEHLYLTDHLTGIVTDLLLSDYTFTTEGDSMNETRFELSAIRAEAGTATTIYDAYVQGAGVQKVLLDGKVYIIRNGVWYDVMGKVVK